MRDGVRVLVDVTTDRLGNLRVFKQGETYTVEVNRSPNHTDCTADDVIRALGHYIHGLIPPRQE